MINRILFLIVVLFSAFIININAQDSIAPIYNSEWKKRIDKETSEIKNQLLKNESNKLSGIENSNKYLFCYSGDNYLDFFERNNTEDQSYVLFEGKEIQKKDYLGFEETINQLFKELDINYKRKVIIYVTDIVHPEIPPLKKTDGKAVSESDFNKEFTKQCFSYLLTKLYGAKSGEYTVLAYLRVFKTQKTYLNSNETRFEYTHKRIFNYQKGLPSGCISLLENKIAKNEDNIFKSTGDQSGQIYECAKLIHSTLKSECPSVINPMSPLTVTGRIDKIKEYLASGLTDNEEAKVLKLIAETPTNDIPRFLAALEGAMSSTNSNSVLAELDDKTEDKIVFYGDNNYSGLIVQLKNLVERSPDLEARLNKLIDPENTFYRIANWRLDKIVTRGSFRKNLGATSLDNINFNHETSEISYRLALFSKDEWISGGCDGPPYHFSCYKTEYFWLPFEEDTKLRPFDLVLFANFSKSDFINDVASVKRGQAVVMPAYFLQYIDLKTDIEESMQAASATIDLATLVNLPWAATKCVSGLRMLYLTIEAANATVNLSVNLIPALNESLEMQEVVSTYNELMLVISAGQLLNGVSTISIKQASIHLKSLSVTSAQEVKRRMKAFVTAINKNEEKIKSNLNSTDPNKKKAAEALISLRDEQVINGKEIFEEDGWENLGRNVIKLDGEYSDFLDDDFVKVTRAEVISSNLIAQFPNFSIEELIAIKVYTSDEFRNGIKIYENLNTQLRGGKLDNYNLAFNNLLNNALKKLPAYSGNIVFRGCGKLESEIAKKWKIGEEISFLDFKSSSIKEDVALNFVFRESGDVIYEISNPKGYNICNISCSPREAEIFFSSGSNFKVTGLGYLPRIAESDPLIRVIELILLP